MSQDTSRNGQDTGQDRSTAPSRPLDKRELGAQIGSIRALLADKKYEQARLLLSDLQQRIQQADPPPDERDYLDALEATNAQLLEALGEHESAQLLYARIFERNPRNSIAASALARLLARGKHFTEALNILQQAATSTYDVKARGYLSNEALLLKLRTHPCRRGSFRAPDLCPADERALAVMVVRDEDDVILASLRHHYCLGLRQFFIMDNMSKDGTSELIQYFKLSHPDALVMHLRDDAGGFLQREKTQSLMEFARKYAVAAGRNPSWCFILDADEFIDGPTPQSGLKELLDRAGDSFAIGFNFCNAASQEGGDFDHHRRSIYDHFNLLQRVGKKPVSKMAFRMVDGVEVSLGNHRVFMPDLTPDRVLAASEADYHLVHLPTRSVRQIMRKAHRSAEVLKAEDVTAGRIWIRPTDIVMRDGEEGARSLLESYTSGIRKSQN